MSPAATDARAPTCCSLPRPPSSASRPAAAIRSSSGVNGSAASKPPSASPVSNSSATAAAAVVGAREAADVVTEVRTGVRGGTGVVVKVVVRLVRGGAGSRVGGGASPGGAGSSVGDGDPGGAVVGGGVNDSSGGSSVVDAVAGAVVVVLVGSRSGNCARTGAPHHATPATVATAAAPTRRGQSDKAAAAGREGRSRCRGTGTGADCRRALAGSRVAHPKAVEPVDPSFAGPTRTGVAPDRRQQRARRATCPPARPTAGDPSTAGGRTVRRRGTPRRSAPT